MTQSAFILHGLLALPPAINFLRLSLKLGNPFYASPSPQPADTLPEAPNLPPILLSYSLLLLSSSICAFFLANAEGLPPSLVKALAGSFGIYHVGPIARAIGRIRAKDDGLEMGGPWVHFLTHVAVGSWLWMVALS